MPSYVKILLASLLAVLFTGACSDDATDNTGGDTDTDTDSDSDTDGDTDTDSDTDSGWRSDECHPVGCDGTVWQCGDCIDNDSDDLVDWRDPDCLGPCDNNEGGFQINIPGSAPGNCAVDCYFDDDNGGGNDNCLWDHRCDPDEQQIKDNTVCDASYVGEEWSDCDAMLDAQSQLCEEFCVPLVPNGCDCFGCCYIGDEERARFIGTPGCSLENLEGCDFCTPVPSCENSCGRCELCIGKDTIPEDCLNTDTDPSDTDPSDTDPSDTDPTVDTEESRCAPTVQPCGLAGDAPCPPNAYCITGCCVSSVLIE